MTGYDYIRKLCKPVAPEAFARATAATDEPTLHDQLEDMLVTVWRCEREWKLDDRINLLAELAR